MPCRGLFNTMIINIQDFFMYIKGRVLKTIGFIIFILPRTQELEELPEDRS